MPWFVWVGSLQSLGTSSPKSWGCWDASRERCWQGHVPSSEKPFVLRDNQNLRRACGNKKPTEMCPPWLGLPWADYSAFSCLSFSVRKMGIRSWQGLN